MRFRYQSPRSGREGVSNSLGPETSSPHSFLRRPKDPRKGSSSLPQTGFHVRKEGFDTAQPAQPVTRSTDFNPTGGAQDFGGARNSNGTSTNSTASPSKGLLSRTLSSGMNNEAMKVSSFLRNLTVTSSSAFQSSLMQVKSSREVTKLLQTKFVWSVFGFTDASGHFMPAHWTKTSGYHIHHCTGKAGALPGKQKQHGR